MRGVHDARNSRSQQHGTQDRKQKTSQAFSKGSMDHKKKGGEGKERDTGIVGKHIKGVPRWEGGTESEKIKVKVEHKTTAAEAQGERGGRRTRQSTSMPAPRAQSQ